jgi:tetratricopeptide (TPR) repeat protein
MASVWRARDVTTQRHVALKMMLATKGATHLALFEREFHALAALKHPNIVEVYDYGVDSRGPHYAMELLAGNDLSGCAPMAWREACGVLRDVASALALLHARRLLHRDVSPRNVWRTTDGKIKLIDFGALAAFGNVSEIAGTPPFVAPEALIGQDLDQRTDLFALGALGYWLLTGMHAYPARHLSDLADAWEIPPKPASARVAGLERPDLGEVPVQLDDLLSALLSVERAGRPTSASEVIERVTALADLDPTDVDHEAGAYVRSTAFVGRGRERSLFRGALENAGRGQGAAILIEGPSGVGRTRLLTELAHDARFMRSLVLQAEAQPNGDLHSFALSMAHKLIDALPDEARTAATPFAATLGHLSPKLRERLWGTRIPLASLPEAPGEARMRMQEALLGWFSSVRSERPLVLMVDDVQTVDGGSAGWLVALARECQDKKLLIVATLREDVSSSPGYVVQALRQYALNLPLAPLTEVETLEFTGSVFGDTPHVRRVATMLFERAAGNPAHTVELVEHLVRQDLARYVGGAWVLPQSVDDDALPADRREVTAAKLLRLTPEARQLAQVLSVHEGALSLPQCRALSDLDPTRLFALLQVLVSEGVLMGAEGGYRFVQHDLLAVLAHELAPERRKRAHLVLGAGLLAQMPASTTDQLRAGLHFMLGGEFERGSELVSRAAIRFGTVEHADTGLVGRELAQAVKLYREAGCSDAELVPVLCAVSQSGYYGERRLATQHGDDALSALQRVLRLPLARRLGPYLGRKLGLIVAIACAAVVMGASRRRNPRIPTLQETIRLLFGSACALAGIATICIDPAGAARYAEAFEPLTALGKDHAASLLYDFCLNLSYTVRDQPDLSIKRWDKFIARLQSAKPIRDLPAYARVFYLGGALYARGVVECWRESSKALEIADRLENITLRLYALSADQLRAFYHAIAGNFERYEYYRERVEMHAVQRGTAWQVEIWAPAAMLTVHLRTRDAMRMKQCVEQLRHLYEELPSLSLYAVRGRGAYALLRGMLREALPLLEKVTEEQPLAVVGWSRQYGALAQVYNLLDQHQRALDTCKHALSHLSEADLEFTAMNLGVQIQKALALAGLGQVQEGANLLDALLLRHADKGAVTLGALHDARLQIARRAGDSVAAALHAGEVKRLYASTGLASLLERSEQLVKPVPSAANHSLPTRGSLQAPPQLATILQRFEHGGGASITSLPEWTLRQLITHAKVSEGYLFRRTESAVVCVAEVGGTCGEVLKAWVIRRVNERAEVADTTVVSNLCASADNPNFLAVQGVGYRLRFLITSNDEVFGAVVLPAAAERPSADVLRVMVNRLVRS